MNMLCHEVLRPAVPALEGLLADSMSVPPTISQGVTVDGQQSPLPLQIAALIRLPTAGGIVNRARLVAPGHEEWFAWVSRTVDVRLRRGIWVIPLRDCAKPRLYRVR